MNKPAIKLMGAAALLGIIATGCGRSDGAKAPVTTAAPAATTAAPVATTAAAAATTAAPAATTAAAAAGPKTVKTDLGVTDKVISLGVLTDQSGQFKSLSSTILAGNQIYFAEKNAAGGVCGRQVELVIKDHGYDVANAKPRYDEIKEKVLGLLHVVGSPMNTKLLPDYAADKMSVVPVSWASSLLKNPYIVMVGPSYDVEIMNGYAFMASDLGLKAGDKVAHIWQEGEYGQNGQTGAKYAAKALGFEYIDVPIKPTDTDLTTQVNDVIAKGAKAISITSGPTQSASVVTVLEQAKSPIPVVSSNPGFSPALLTGAAKDAMLKHFYIVAAAAPYSSDSPKVKKLVASFEGNPAYKDVAKAFPINFGYAQGELYATALQKACDAGDLTRDGLHAAFGSIKSFDSGGLITVVDYSKPGGITARENYVAKADDTQPGGLKLVKAGVTADFAKAYVPA